MNPLDRLKQAEEDGLSVTLTPSELTELNDYVEGLLVTIECKESAEHDIRESMKYLDDRHCLEPPDGGCIPFPEQVGNMRRELDDWMGMYRVSAEREARIRLVALEARDALRGYNHRSEIAERLTRVCRGEE